MVGDLDPHDEASPTRLGTACHHEYMTVAAVRAHSVSGNDIGTRLIVWVLIQLLTYTSLTGHIVLASVRYRTNVILEFGGLNPSAPRIICQGPSSILIPHLALFSSPDAELPEDGAADAASNRGRKLLNDLII